MLIAHSSDRSHTARAHEAPPPQWWAPEIDDAARRSTPPRVRPVTATGDETIPIRPDSATARRAPRCERRDGPARGKRRSWSTRSCRASSVVGFRRGLAQPAHRARRGTIRLCPAPKATVAAPSPTRRASPPPPCAAAAMRQSTAGTTAIVHENGSRTSQADRASLPSRAVQQRDRPRRVCEPVQPGARREGRAGCGASWSRSALRADRTDRTSPSQTGRYDATKGQTRPAGRSAISVENRRTPRARRRTPSASSVTTGAVRRRRSAAGRLVRKAVGPITPSTKTDGEQQQGDHAGPARQEPDRRSARSSRHPYLGRPTADADDFARGGN